MTTGLELMRKPFPPHQINRLPKGGVTLSYVGHAALTDRLLDADPSWSWEPVAFGEDGLPKLDANGGLWIRLTVCGVTRLGYGDSGDKKGPNAMKERIGDALRNAAMRFGAALDLWHKGELHIDEAVAEMEIAQPEKATKKQPVNYDPKAHIPAKKDVGLTIPDDWKKYFQDVAAEVERLVEAGNLQQANYVKYQEKVPEEFDDWEIYFDTLIKSSTKNALKAFNQPKAA